MPAARRSFCSSPRQTTAGPGRAPGDRKATFRSRAGQAATLIPGRRVLSLRGLIVAAVIPGMMMVMVLSPLTVMPTTRHLLPLWPPLCPPPCPPPPPPPCPPPDPACEVPAKAATAQINVAVSKMADHGCAPEKFLSYSAVRAPETTLTFREPARGSRTSIEPPARLPLCNACIPAAGSVARNVRNAALPLCRTVLMRFQVTAGSTFVRNCRLSRPFRFCPCLAR